MSLSMKAQHKWVTSGWVVHRDDIIMMSSPHSLTHVWHFFCLNSTVHSGWLMERMSFWPFPVTDAGQHKASQKLHASLVALICPKIPSLSQRARSPWTHQRARDVSYSLIQSAMAYVFLFWACSCHLTNSHTFMSDPLETIHGSAHTSQELETLTAWSMITAAALVLITLQRGFLRL